MLTTVAAGRVFDYSYCIGMYGMSGQGFWSPQDFALAGDTMYVLSRGAEELGQRVSRVTLDHQFLGQFGAFGRGDGQFVWPRSIALDGDGNVYASDDFLNRVSVFDPEGTFLSCWGEGRGRQGAVERPVRNGIRWLTATFWWWTAMNNRVQKFTSEEGKFLGKFRPSRRWRRRVQPALGHVPGRRRQRVRRRLEEQPRAEVRRRRQLPAVKFEATPTSGVGDLHGPTGVAVDSEGDVYVTDWGNHRLQVYAPDGRFIATLVGDAQQPSPWTQTYIDANPDIVKARRRVNLEPEWRFRRPVSVRVDENDRIFVLEANRHRIQVYDKVKDYEEHPLNL